MPKDKNKNILDIIQGISQVMANSFDGAKDKEGEPIKVGLKREEGHPVLNSRIMDGFSASVQADKLIINYQSEIKLTDVHSNKFEQEIKNKIEDIVKYLKKEFKNVTGESLTLSNPSEMKAKVQRISNIRTWVEAKCIYTIGGIDLQLNKDEHQKKLEDNFKEWMKQNEKKAPRPKNEKIKPKDNYL